METNHFSMGQSLCINVLQDGTVEVIEQSSAVVVIVSFDGRMY